MCMLMLAIELYSCSFQKMKTPLAGSGDIIQPHARLVDIYALTEMIILDERREMG